MPITAQRLKFLRSLSRKKFRDEHAVFLAEGLRLVRDAIAAGAPIVEVYVTPAFAGAAESGPLLAQLRSRAMVLEVRARDLDAFTDAVSAQGIAALVKESTLSAADLLERGKSPALLVALDAVSDPGNLGTLIRTCDWFGVQGILVGRNSVELFNPKVVRATMGGIFRMPVAEGVDLPAALSRARELGYTLYATAPEGGIDAGALRMPGRSILILGNEAWGISDAVAALAHHRITIPRRGAGESLNVGVACGIILASVKRGSH